MCWDRGFGFCSVRHQPRGVTSLWFLPRTLAIDSQFCLFPLSAVPWVLGGWWWMSWGAQAVGLASLGISSSVVSAED